MSYLTLEAEIRDGKIIVNEPGKLPESGQALVTILSLAEGQPKQPALIEALGRLQSHLQLNSEQATQWMSNVRDARR